MNSVQYPGSPRPVYPARPPGAMHSGHPINYITIHAQLYFAHPHPQVFRHIYLALLAFPPPLLLPFPPAPPVLRRPRLGRRGVGRGDVSVTPISSTRTFYISLVAACIAPRPPTHPFVLRTFSHVYSVPLQPTSLSHRPFLGPVICLIVYREHYLFVILYLFCNLRVV